MKSQCPRCKENGKDTKENGLELYEDGHKYCFKCHYYEPGDGTGKSEGGNDLDLLGFFPNALKSRKLSKEVCERYHYGVNKLGDKWVRVINHFENGRIIGQKVKGERKEDQHVRGKILDIYGMWLFEPDREKCVIITEGEEDCLAVSQAMGPDQPVVSCGKGAKSTLKGLIAHHEWFSGFSGVILALDADSDGQVATQGCLNGSSLTMVSVIPTRKDWCDMLMKDEEDEIKSTMVNGIEEVQAVKMKMFVNLDELDVTELNKPRAEGLKIGFPEFDKMTNGLQRGVVSCIVSGSGFGKSTLIFAITKALMSHKKIGLILLEHSEWEIINHLVCYILGVDRAEMEKGLISVNNDDYQKAFDEIKGRLIIFQPYQKYNSDVIKGTITSMAEMGAELVILDNFNIMLDCSPSKDTFAFEGQISVELHQLIKELDIYFLMANQINKMSNKPDSKGWFNIDQSALRGSSSILYNIKLLVSLEFNKDTKERRLRVTKNNIYGDVGEADTFSIKPNGAIEIGDKYEEMF